MSLPSNYNTIVKEMGERRFWFRDEAIEKRLLSVRFTIVGEPGKPQPDPWQMPYGPSLHVHATFTPPEGWQGGVAFYVQQQPTNCSAMIAHSLSASGFAAKVQSFLLKNIAIGSGNGYITGTIRRDVDTDFWKILYDYKSARYGWGHSVHVVGADIPIDEMKLRHKGTGTVWEKKAEPLVTPQTTTFKAQFVVKMPKAKWDPAKHPRYPDGTFMSKADANKLVLAK